MEHAPLRPVPSHLAGPVEPAAAARAVALMLPDLEQRSAHALALVALAGRQRADTAESLGIGVDELARDVAAARKALRRTLRPLTGSGWCERAERLISDRLDGDLGDRDVARLDVHLRNCPRCVEHERRLVQATDMLLAELADSLPAAEPATPPAELTVVAEVEREVEEADPSPPPAERTTPAAAPAPARSTRRLAAVAWNLLTVLAVILALASLGLVLAGVLGADL